MRKKQDEDGSVYCHFPSKHGKHGTFVLKGKGIAKSFHSRLHQNVTSNSLRPSPTKSYEIWSLQDGEDWDCGPQKITVGINAIVYKGFFSISTDLTFQHFLTAWKDRSVPFLKRWWFLKTFLASCQTRRRITVFKRQQLDYVYNKTVESIPHLPLPSMPTSPKWFRSFTFLRIKFTCIPLLPCSAP
jgi:hypothetical protein